VKDKGWDALMLGFNLLNQGAADSIIPKAKQSDKAVIVMFAVRKALRSNEELEVYLKERFQGEDSREKQINEILKTLKAMPSPLPELAYQYCRDTEGTDVTLFGTGSIKHLNENIRSFKGSALPSSAMEMLKRFHMAGAGLTGQ
jgi:aryl-alcohol dehydrogenase-like predicted oxidoreductase